MKPKDRHISILDYFNVLQSEYLLYELRSKIYPSSEDKVKFKEVLFFKKQKIEDISSKNDLVSIFETDEFRKEKLNELFGGNCVPSVFSKRDTYFYYSIGSDFSFKGVGVKLYSYDLENQTAIVLKGSEKVLLDLLDIRRIL